MVAAKLFTILEDVVTYVVQVNGNVREKLGVAADAGEDAVKGAALASEKVQKWLEGKTVVKTVFVPGKLVGLVVK